MAAIKRVILPSVPGMLAEGTEVFVENGSGLDLYIGNGSNSPVLVSGNQFASLSGGNTFSGRIDADGGISFDGGTNVLDRYEHGNWTPVMDSTNNDVDWDITIHDQWYEVRNNILECFADFTINTINTQGTGTFCIDGLPKTYSGEVVGTLTPSNFNMSSNHLWIVPQQVFGNRVRFMGVRDNNLLQNIPAASFEEGNRFQLKFSVKL